MKLFFLPLILVVGGLALATEPKSTELRETFDENFDSKRFLTPIPNKNTEVRQGALWTHGPSGGKYPPMVYLPVEGMT